MESVSVCGEEGEECMGGGGVGGRNSNTKQVNYLQRRREVFWSGTATSSLRRVAPICPREARKKKNSLSFFSCLDGLS